MSCAFSCNHITFSYHSSCPTLFSFELDCRFVYTSVIVLDLNLKGPSVILVDASWSSLDHKKLYTFLSASTFLHRSDWPDGTAVMVTSKVRQICPIRWKLFIQPGVRRQQTADFEKKKNLNLPRIDTKQSEEDPFPRIVQTGVTWWRMKMCRGRREERLLIRATIKLNSTTSFHFTDTQNSCITPSSLPCRHTAPSLAKRFIILGHVQAH